MDYPRACWQCRHYEGMTGQNTAALCRRGDGPRVRSGPHDGCSQFEADLGGPYLPPEGWEPPGTHVQLVATITRSRS